MQQPVKIDLKHPVEVQGQTVASVTMRRPKVRDLLAAEKATQGESEREVWLIACLCEVAPAVIEELFVADFIQLKNQCHDFLS